MPAFKAQHYETVASVLYGCKPINDGEQGLYMDYMAQWERTCLAFINHFRQDNQQFDQARFLKRCTGEPHGRKQPRTVPTR